LQSSPQSIPLTSEVTRPAPSPARRTEQLFVGTKRAPTRRERVISRAQPVAPVQSSLQASKRWPCEALAVSVTGVPSAHSWLQSLGQSTPDGTERTTPLPSTVTSSE